MVRRGGVGRRGQGVEFGSLGSGCVLRILMSLFYASLVNVLRLLRLLRMVEGVRDGMTTKIRKLCAPGLS